jgi:hypothetical protein
MPEGKEFTLMQAQIERTAESVEDIALRVSSIDRALRGNGSKGLFTKHDLLETRVASLEDFTKEIKALRRWLTTGVCAVLGSVLWSAAQMYLKGQQHG